MGFNDREYAPSVSLPSWLKDFANRELKGSSPSDEIADIFRGKSRHKEAKDAVEAKVEELCDRVGLNMIEKQASLKSESAAGYVGPIEEQTGKNKSFRKVLFTGEHAQLVVMSVEGGEELGEEVHKSVDQFFRIEEGEATFVLNGTKKNVKADEAVIIPAGTKHNVINVSKTEPLKMYTIYSPPNHPDGTVHKTKEDAEKAEEAEVKAALIKELIVLANKFESDGKIIAAKLIDSRIKRLADEILLSNRDINDVQTANDDKDVFDKYPGIKKHINNVCEHREGHIDTPALMQIIKSRPETLTNKELEQVKEYIKGQIKDNKPEVDAFSDDDVIGRGGDAVDMEDDGNSEVFSLPSKV